MEEKQIYPDKFEQIMAKMIKESLNKEEMLEALYHFSSLVFESARDEDEKGEFKILDFTNFIEQF